MKYRAEIDGLRALAVIPVILFHAGFDLFRGGFVGVDVFFVISGYLITTILIEDIENNQFRLVDFYERRARRILPALFFVLIICIPLAWILMLPNEMKAFSQSLIAVSIFVSNILFWRQSGYFDTAAEEKPLLHTWSLAVEEQYYVLFPIFLIAAWRLGKNKVFWTIVIIAIISLLASEWGWRHKASANFYLAPTRAWELLSGSIAAFIVHKNGVQKNTLLSILGLGAIIFSILVYDKNTPFPSVYTLVPVIGVVLLILFADKNTIVAKLLSTKAFVSIGLLSYSAYLWHQPLFAFARAKSEVSPSEYMMIFFSITSIALAYISWRFVETPFRNKRKFGRGHIFTGSIVGLIFFIAVGFLGYKTEGFENFTLNDYERAVYRSIERSSEPNCGEEINECLEYSGNGNKTLLLIGDSNAYHFSKGLRELAEEYSYKYIQLTRGGCMPMANFYSLDQSISYNRECISYNQNILANLNNLSNKLDVIVVSSAWLLYYYGDELLRNLTDSYGIDPINKVRLSIDGVNEIANKDKDEVFAQYFNDMFSLLKAKANKVIVVGPLPPTIVNFQKRSFISSKNEYSSQQYYDAVLPLETLLKTEVAKFKLTYIDIADELCGSGVCKVTNDGRYLYGDRTHFSDLGQSTIIRPILEQQLHFLDQTGVVE